MLDSNMKNRRDDKNRRNSIMYKYICLDSINNENAIVGSIDINYISADSINTDNVITDSSDDNVSVKDNISSNDDMSNEDKMSSEDNMSNEDNINIDEKIKIDNIMSDNLSVSSFNTDDVSGDAIKSIVNSNREIGFNKISINSKKNYSRSRRVDWRRYKRLKKSIATIIMIIVCVASSTIIYNNTPSVIADKYYKSAIESDRDKRYDEAIEAYTEALRIEKKSVRTYRSMANTYLHMGNSQAAIEVLDKGIENTEDEDIKCTLATVLLNESISDVNDGNIDCDTIGRCLEIVKLDPGNQEVIEVIGRAFRIYCGVLSTDGSNSEDADNTFFIKNEDSGERIDNYCSMIGYLREMYDISGNEYYSDLLIDSLMMSGHNMHISSEYVEVYYRLLIKMSEGLSDAGLSRLIDCLTREREVWEYCIPILEAFDREEYEVAREVIVSNDYLDMRDRFIGGLESYWKGETYIPFGREGIIIYNEAGIYRFSYIINEDEPCDKGCIKLWGFRWLDNGRQRTGITYIPASVGDDYYPHEEIEILYWWSTVKNQRLTVDTYARMNYRFERRIFEADSMTAYVINDWGGEFEYEDVYE